MLSRNKDPNFCFNYQEEIMDKLFVKTLGFFGFKKRYLVMTHNKLALFENQKKYDNRKDPKVSSFYLNKL